MTTKSNATSEQTSTAAKTTAKSVKKATEKVVPKLEPKSLISKIIDAVKATKPVTKDGRNDYSNYSYTSDQQVSAIIHSLADAGVWFIPNFEITDKWEKGKNNYVQVQGHFMLTDGNEKYDGSMPGIGADTLDKAVYKAETGAKKNFFMQFLALSTDTDTDDDHGKDMNSSNANAQSVQRQQSVRPASQAEINTLSNLLITYSGLKKQDPDKMLNWALKQMNVTELNQASQTSVNQVTALISNAINKAEVNN